MTWFNFAIWLALLYLLYYGTLILWDIYRERGMPKQDKGPELTFVPDIVPEKVMPENDSTTTAELASSIISSGGRVLKDIFKLAQEEAIEYIRPVSF